MLTCYCGVFMLKNIIVTSSAVVLGDGIEFIFLWLSDNVHVVVNHCRFTRNQLSADGTELCVNT